MTWAGDELWVVNTQFSCPCTLHEDNSFVPRWRLPFVTALAETDTPVGWRPNKAAGGCLVDVPTGQTVARGFATPHSPRVYQGRVWLLDSGTGRLVVVDPSTGGVETVAELPGYTRGLALHESFAFVGLCKIRETSVFGGLPIAERHEGLQCGVAVVDLRTCQRLAGHQFGQGRRLLEQAPPLQVEPVGVHDVGGPADQVAEQQPGDGQVVREDDLQQQGAQPGDAASRGDARPAAVPFGEAAVSVAAVGTVC